MKTFHRGPNQRRGALEVRVSGLDVANNPFIPDGVGAGVPVALGTNGLYGLTIGPELQFLGPCYDGCPEEPNCVAVVLFSTAPCCGALVESHRFIVEEDFFLGDEVWADVTDPLNPTYHTADPGGGVRIGYVITDAETGNSSGAAGRLAEVAF